VTVHVGEMTSEVVVEPEPDSGATGEAGQAGGWTWADEDRFRALQERTYIDRARTRAEGFDA
jgi:hypothetical protein